MAGIYRRLLKYEREKCSKLDPRLVMPGTLVEPKVFRRSDLRLKAMEADEPTLFPWWMLGGHTVRVCAGSSVEA
ncbi:hypothetical protein [Mycobacterium sp. E3305]|uniref:hypothetical protein n=1 Tax=Mycobacterium sp. E3305 TaxID=1834145 RepID=UPI000834A8DE|nr:hypothetical protein [Mycobacterium sp. E3305]